MATLADLLYGGAPQAAPQYDERMLEAIARGQMYMDMDKLSAASPMPTSPQVPEPPTQAPLSAPPAPAPAAPPVAAPATPTPAAPAEPAAAQPDRVAGWKQVLDKVKQPDVMGPLQTFFATLSAPMSPWENGASRLGRAAQLASLHRNMLLENAKNKPKQDELDALQMRQERAKTDSAEIGVANDQAAADYNATRARTARATAAQDIQKSYMEIDALRQQGLIREAQIKEDALKAKYANENALLDLAIKRRTANAPYFKPDSTKASDAATQEDVLSAYDSEIWAPFVQWKNAAWADGETDVSWAAFLKANPAIATRYRQIAKDAQKAGMKMTTRNEAQYNGTAPAAPVAKGGTTQGKVIDWNSIK